MVRLRDRLGSTPPFAGVDLCYGVYDWGGTPSTKQQIGKVPYATGDGTNRKHYLPGRSLEECRDPAISPLWAPLHDLPPALITVGTADWLLDDSLFLAARLEAAGSPVELAVYPEGPHGIESVADGARQDGPRPAARVPARACVELADGIRITARWCVPSLTRPRGPVTSTSNVSLRPSMVRSSALMSMDSPLHHRRFVADADVGADGRLARLDVIGGHAEAGPLDEPDHRGSRQHGRCRVVGDAVGGDLERHPVRQAR